ncbi:hypothetical protein [Mesorhizobium sp.]|uniref:hypothetical protein n=1 Tax=Mesorhizobium sp. TaxID=1871066 RepID=UPI00122ABDB7|nr:hypothetical protein [Mesorhizobium sp.]TIM78520.1 MAG: hypothetical protein E5Y58_02910 [Mesorhizobium sp.]
MIWPLRGRSALGLGAGIAAACAFGTPLASAHDDWYEKQCCHDEHCEPMADGAVRETSKGFKVPSGELLPYADGRVRQSHDMRFHWCHAQKVTAGRHREFPSRNADITICLYVPPKSF